ncbi:sigma-70 family RNA polymerase sigma factor [Qipengyuania spongiae]|uniref:RNA polymerase sigma factor n=1 Tax=Qipengyuania spongiae TaxID=2909673 RepID=A0ABY5T2I4_9SPHN|nr:sigma-70 family RNA polymerase sigma factor [Qipengyuania spongiae]UVI39543.1 sigma-70 family RNA polymerase sigma factor [Qipengyuania spongiae]
MTLIPDDASFFQKVDILCKNAEPGGGDRMADRRARLTAELTAVAAGNRGSLERVYEMTSAKLFGTILRIVRRRDVAEDVLQEVYVKVWRRAGRYDPEKGSPITWLSTIARNSALNDVRTNGRREEIAEDVFPEVVDTQIVAADDWLCAEQENAALAECLEELKDDHRRTIKMAFFEGLSHSELCERCDVPLGTLKSWIRRGLARLKSCLDE